MGQIGEKEAVWIPESDEALPGTVEPQNQTDQRCPHCGRWFENRGFNGHVEDCHFANSDYYEYNTETERVEYNELAWAMRGKDDEYFGQFLKEVE
jgi:hypothetical protein